MSVPSVGQTKIICKFSHLDFWCVWRWCNYNCKINLFTKD